jgi:hypothetical protein
MLIKIGLQQAAFPIVPQCLKQLRNSVPTFKIIILIVASSFKFECRKFFHYF